MTTKAVSDLKTIHGLLTKITRDMGEFTRHGVRPDPETIAEDIWGIQVKISSMIVAKESEEE